MELKRILARDSRTANEKAIHLYGPDVLIISSQRMDNQTELIVAVDLVSAVAVKEAFQVTPVELTRGDASASLVPFSKLFESASAFVPLPSDEKWPASGLTGEAALAVPQAAPQVALQVATAPQASFQDANDLQTRHDERRSHEIVEMLRIEMAALRKEFSLSRQMMPWQEGLRLSPAAQQLSLAMIEAGMPTGLRALLTDSIQDFESVQDALPVMASLLVSSLNRPDVPVPDSGVHALCGPSGSGKTSMVGRLAYAAARVHGVERQVMVSFADQRPGAWAQMQLLAAQSGVACFRAASSDMLSALLQDFEGKTIWIDTCGTDFLAQAESLQSVHPKVFRHAVLPVDATFTSVQKIFQNSTVKWSSLMLSKLDEGACPWALIKGLSEHGSAVSCMAGASGISQSPEPFDATQLVQLAMAPVIKNMSQAFDAKTPVLELLATDPPSAPIRSSRNKKQTHAAVKKPSNKRLAKSCMGFVEDEILIPTLIGDVSVASARQKIGRSRTALKVANG